jgi:hypothetical protein
MGKSLSCGVVRVTGCCVAVTALLLAGCASKEANPDVELQELIQMLPGHYDNVAQAQSDVAKGVQPPHEALVLDIVPIDAVMIGENVFYVQEGIAGDPRRVLGQKIMVLGVVKKDVVQTDFALADPHRWRNGQLNPELFKGIMTQDVHSTKGCSLRWKRSEGKFVGANEPKTCHGRAGGAGGIAQIESKAELGPEEYATAELAFDKPGHLALGRGDDPFYRFRKATTESE